MVSWRRCNSCGNLTGDNETHCPFCQQPFYDVINAQTSVALNVAPSVPTPPQQPQDNTQETNAKKAKAVDGFVIENGVLTYYCGFYVNVVIPETVVEIASEAFDDFRQHLNSVTFPKSLKRIAKGAFKDCVNLYKVIFNDQLENIEDEAFMGCKYLANVELPDSISSIGKHAFDSCISITDIRIPNIITEIMEGSFKGCTSLVNVLFPEGIKIIWAYVFENCCSLKSIVFPDSLESLGAFALRNCISIEEITIPEKCTGSTGSKKGDTFIYGGEVFLGCSALKRVVYKSHPRRILPRMYKDCVSLLEISIPDSVEEIHDGAFENCKTLTNISLPQSVKTIGKEAFKGCAKLEKIDIPSNSQIETLSDSVFADCSSLVSISILQSTKNIGEKAFFGCTNLKEVTIQEDSQLSSIKNDAFEKCSSLTSIFIPRNIKSIEKNTFSGCAKLEKVIIPSDSQLDIIKENAFEKCSSLKSIVLPENLTKIEKYAFRDCQNLTELNIPYKTFFEFKAFIYTPNLRIQMPKEIDNLSRLACAAYQKNIQLKNTGYEFKKANENNFWYTFSVPELGAYTSYQAANARIANSLLVQETIDRCRQTNNVTLVFIRSFELSGETIYDFIPYEVFAEECIGFSRGSYKYSSKYQNISTDVNNDYLKVLALTENSGINDCKVDVIQAPVLDSVPGSFLGLKVGPTGKTQNFVRVQFPYNHS